MSSQTSLVTEAARTAAIQNTADFTAGVAKHISGEWGEHNQVAVHDQAFNTLSLAAFATYAAHTITDAKCLRFLLMINGSPIIVAIPGLASGSYSGGGTDSGSPSAEAPTFTLNPISAELTAGSSVTLTVTVSGTEPILLQWTKNGTTIGGATSTSYSITNFQEADAGNYNCVATNSVGQTISTTAVLALRVESTPTVPERDGVSGGGCFTRHTFVTLANGVSQPISSIRRGDRVRSYNIAGLSPDIEEAWRSFAQSTLSATPAEAVVKEVLLNQFTYFYRINEELEVTYEHAVLVKRGNVWKFMRVQDLRTGDYLFKNGSAAPIHTIYRVDTPIQTFNLNVEPYDVFVANGFIVHNAISKL